MGMQSVGNFERRINIWEICANSFVRALYFALKLFDQYIRSIKYWKFVSKMINLSKREGKLNNVSKSSRGKFENIDYQQVLIWKSRYCRISTTFSWRISKRKGDQRSLTKVHLFKFKQVGISIAEEKENRWPNFGIQNSAISILSISPKPSQRSRRSTCDNSKSLSSPVFGSFDSKNQKLKRSSNTSIISRPLLNFHCNNKKTTKLSFFKF